MSAFNTLVYHSNISDVITALEMVNTLDPSNKTRGMLLLAGLPKTGKNRVVKDWINSHRSQQMHQRVALPIPWIEVWKPERASFGNKTYVTPVTCILFNEIAYALGEISTRFGPAYADHTWYRQPRSLYTDHQFATLLSFVRAEIKRLRVPLLVINEAQLLDARALEMLMLLRGHQDNQLAIVLVARMQQDAELDEPLHEELLHVPTAHEICTRVELEQLTEHTYKKNVLDALLADLNLDVVEDLESYEHEIADLLWKQTGPDWKLIDEKQAQKLLKLLGSDRSKVRTITREVLTAVLEKPLPF